MSLDLASDIVFRAFPYFYRSPPLPPYTLLPPPFVGPNCNFKGRCDDGCRLGYRCADDQSGCCEPDPTYADTVCSLDKKMEVHRYIGDHGYTEIKDVALCDYAGCENGKCRNYADSRSDIPQCGEEHTYVPILYGFQTNRANFYVCMKDGNPVIREEDDYENVSAFYGQFLCKSDASSVIYSSSGKTALTCSGNTHCMKDVWGHPDCMTTDERYGCSQFQKRNDGYACTLNGLRCTPGEILPATDRNPCRRVCADDGIASDLKFPLECSPSDDDYADRFCKDNETHKVEVVDVKVKAVKEADCPNGCKNGYCTADTGQDCTYEGSLMTRKDGACKVVCENGRYRDTGPCGRISVLSYNNISRDFIYRTLARLPKELFSNMDLTYVARWEEYSPRPNPQKGIFPATQAAYRYLGSYAMVSDMGDELGVFHEFFHAWAKRKYPRYLPFDRLVLYISEEIDVIEAPVDYAVLTGCKDRNGKRRNAEPFPEYGIHDDYDCGEDFAITGADYIVSPCFLQSKSPERYNYFRDHMFADPKTGKVTEYISPDGCG